MIIKTITLLLLLLPIAAISFAQPNPAFMLDSSFGNDGKVQTKINDNGFQSAGIASILLQPDGKIVAAGSTGFYAPQQGYGVITRYLPDGTIDASFGKSGFVYSDINGLETTQIVQIKQQSSGKIIVLSTDFDNDNKVYYYLGRYNIDGSPDTSFGNNGQLRLPSPTYSLAIQPDNKILTCGNKSNQAANTYEVRVRRYNTNGKVDSSFGTDGLTAVQLGIAMISGYPCIALDHRERIVVASNSSFTNIQTNNTVVLRLTSQGNMDSSFNGTGISTGSSLYPVIGLQALCIQTDNSVIVGGSTATDANHFMLSHFKENGANDMGFGTNGFVISNFTVPGKHTSYDYLNALEIQDDRKIVAVGYGFRIGTSRFYFEVARYLPDGTPDSSFGFGNGLTATPIDKGAVQANAMAIQPDGNIIAAGYAKEDNLGNNGGGDFALVRYRKEKKINKLTADRSLAFIPGIRQPSISLYPDPASNYVVVNGLQTGTPTTIIVNDGLGKVLAVYHTDNAEQYRCNVSKCKPGVYYIKVITTTKKETLKFVKE